jgi:AraC family transcriptional regulator
MNYNQRLSYQSIEGNIVDVSSLTKFSSSKLSGNFTLRYVAEGVERYQVNNTKYNVRAEEYIITNKFSEGSILIDSKEPVIGICIDVSQNLFSEVISGLITRGSNDINIEFSNYFNNSEFFENKFHIRQTKVGTILKHIEAKARENNWKLIFEDKWVYYQLAEALIQDNRFIFNQLQKIETVKKSTKKDLLRKLYKGKVMMDERFLNNIILQNISKESGISEYYFFRLFKNVFGVSPHQYIIEKRLQHAKHILKKDTVTISELAYQCGYTDVFSFSKAFKKQFGFAPSLIHKNSRI